jgi:hypothetical protein
VKRLGCGKLPRQRNVTGLAVIYRCDIWDTMWAPRWAPNNHYLSLGNTVDLCVTGSRNRRVRVVAPGKAVGVLCGQSLAISIQLHIVLCNALNTEYLVVYFREL